MFRSLVCPGVLLLAALAAGCGDPPAREMHQAQGAIEAARAAGAAEYAAEEFHAAETALQKAQASVVERDYRQALSAALDARERARDAAKMAAENRARARSDIELALTAAVANLDRTTAALEAAVAAKVPAVQLAPARRVLSDARRALDTARAAVEAGDDAAISRMSAEPATEASWLDGCTGRPAQQVPARVGLPSTTATTCTPSDWRAAVANCPDCPPPYTHTRWPSRRAR